MKQPNQQRSELLKFRLGSAEKEAFQTAAEIAGIPVSAWMRERLRRAASKELQDSGIPIPFYRQSRRVNDDA